MDANIQIYILPASGRWSHSLPCRMSFGGHVARNASEAEKLQDALAGIDIADHDNRSDVSMEQMIADEIVSIASSAATMERQTLEQMVVELQRQLRRANAQRTAACTATVAKLLNQAIHDRSLDCKPYLIW